MQCLNCGFENIPGLHQCARCQSNLSFADVVVEPPRRKRTLLGWFANHAWRLGHSLRLGSQGIGIALGKARPRSATVESLALSIIPGLGQIHGGQRKLGKVILIAWLLAAAMALLLVETANGWLAYGAVLSIHSVAIALVLAMPMQQKPFVVRILVGLGVFLILHFVLYGSVRYVLGGFITPAQVTGAAANGVVAKGDVLAYKGSFLARPGYARCDLVFYQLVANNDIGHMAVQQNGVGLDRIIGQAGDVVSFDKGKVFVNGKELPKEAMPLRPMDALTGQVQAGPDEFIIVPSLMQWQVHGMPPDAVARTVKAYLIVKKQDILGKVFWRLHPVSRFGPVE